MALDRQAEPDHASRHPCRLFGRPEVHGLPKVDPRHRLQRLVQQGASRAHLLDVCGRVRRSLTSPLFLPLPDRRTPMTEQAVWMFNPSRRIAHATREPYSASYSICGTEFRHAKRVSTHDLSTSGSGPATSARRSCCGRPPSSASSLLAASSLFLLLFRECSRQLCHWSRHPRGSFYSDRWRRLRGRQASSLVDWGRP